jgi:hypothetical protein
VLESSGFAVEDVFVRDVGTAFAAGVVAAELVERTAQR